jgi:hypothetical protein
MRAVPRLALRRAAAPAGCALARAQRREAALPDAGIGWRGRLALSGAGAAARR